MCRQTLQAVIPAGSADTAVADPGFDNQAIAAAGSPAVW
jgi:hypothetical protein